MADRMAVVAWDEIFRVFPHIHIDGAERVRTADVKYENTLQVRELDDFEAVRCDEFARAAGRLAPGMRFKLQGLFVAFIDHSSRPILKRNIFNIDPRVQGAAWLVALRID